MPDPGPLAGEPRDRQYQQSAPARVGAWLAWWVLLMSLWVMLDDSLATDELLAGAGAAALAALVAEVASYQAATRFRIRVRWLVPALRLPGQVAADTVTVYAALWRRVARGEQPACVTGADVTGACATASGAGVAGTRPAGLPRCGSGLESARSSTCSWAPARVRGRPSRTPACWAGRPPGG